jgi:glycosyltransferase involved in cell wall biosynthesis
MNVTSSGIWMEPGTGRLVDALHEAFPHMTLAMSDHGADRSSFNSHRTSFTSIDVVCLPKISSLPHGLTKWRACKRSLRHIDEKADILLVQLPFDSPWAVRALTRPTLYHMCADIRSVSRSSRFRGPMRFAAHCAAVWIDSLYSNLVNSESSRLVANGEKLFAKYGSPKGKWLVSSALSERDIQLATRKRPRNAPFRILYVGYVRRWKGVDILLDAYCRLLANIENAELYIVGPTDSGEQAAADDLQIQIRELEKRSAVTVTGHVPFGPELLQFFADADALVVPSRGVEGTPRVLIEARAFGCPVIATDVGGVRSTIDDGVDGLIIPPNDAEACKNALLRIAREPELRHLLIENGRKRALSHTVESFAAEVIAELDILAGLNRHGIAT